MYKKSKLTGNIYSQDMVMIPQDDSNEIYNAYFQWRIGGGVEQEIENTNEELIDIAIKEETLKYQIRAADGLRLVSNFSAKLRVAKLNGVINEESHKIIDDTLIPVRTEVLAGQFKSAKYRLEEIGISMIGQNLYDEILTELDNYMLINY